MQQLTLQFEGYADSRPAIDASTAKRCVNRLKANELSVGWALRQLNPSAALDRVLGNIKLFAQATFLVCFCFSLMFLSALIGG